MKHILIVGLLALVLGACKKEAQENPSTCVSERLDTSLNYTELVSGLDQQLLLSLAEQPSDFGALGRNKQSYFHVRFQMNMTKLADIAVVMQREDALKAYLKNLDYSFGHQEQDGGYALVLPEELENETPVTDGDKVSAVAFFGYSLGISLMALEQSDWFGRPENEAFQAQIDLYHPNIRATLNYLKVNKTVLEDVDQQAPNRLLFDAVAFYTLGRYLADEEAQAMGLQFAESALTQVNESAGYFMEGGGWDSSYNGVALKIGLELFSLLPTSDLKVALGDKLVCAMSWQASRILPDGEIITDGNTRVYPGGESFLGKEKSVDAEKTIMALQYFSIFTDHPAYQDLARQVLNFYK